MGQKKHNYAALGMLMGTSIGGGLSVIAFALTGNPVLIAFSGVGTALGLVLGAAMDSRPPKEHKDS